MEIRSGLEVITTSSPHNFELLKSLGSDHVFDYVRPLLLSFSSILEKVDINK
jgi:hypothetical protein